MGSTAVINGGKASGLGRPHWIKRRLSKKIVSIVKNGPPPKRTTADRIETRLHGVLRDYERKLARSRATFWIAVTAVAVGICIVVVVLVLYSNYTLQREIQVLTFDRNVAEARAVCNESLRKRVALTRADLMTPLQESVWVGQCIEQRLGSNGSAANGHISTAKSRR